MFEIQYKFSENYTSVNINTDETDLRYNLFLGSVNMSIDNIVISIDWSWLPILDFAISIYFISKTLTDRKNAEQVFEFTESNEKIVFIKANNRIEISATFAGQIIEVDFAEFKNVVVSFYRKVLFDILHKNPGLKNNTVFIGYLRDIIE